MAKEKWGTKRTCPKCATRFYDLGKEDPVVCIECDNEWVPEPILKSRSPQLAAIKKPVEKVVAATKDEKAKDDAIDEDDLPDEDDEGNPDDDLDIDDGGDVADVVPGTKTSDAG